MSTISDMLEDDASMLFPPVETTPTTDNMLQVDTTSTVGTANIVPTLSTEGTASVVCTLPAGDTTTVTLMAPADTIPSISTMPIADGMPIIVALPAAEAMGSGDATSSVQLVAAMLTAQDVQDLILPDPSVVNLLPHVDLPSVATAKDNSQPMDFAKLKDKGVLNMGEELGTDYSNWTLSPTDIDQIQKFCNLNLKGEGSDMKFDLAKLEVLFRCETCQEMPISSATVHTCDFGHQVCGHCYDNGARTCLVCKGHLKGNSIPMENVLKRLREGCPNVFNKTTPPPGTRVDLDYLSRFYSLKPLNCPHDGCRYFSSARSLPSHFQSEHKNVCEIELPLFKTCKVVVPASSLENTAGHVIAKVDLTITDVDIASRLFTDTMLCLVQTAAIPTENRHALALWVSCVYEDEIMPPILYSLRVCKDDGFTSFDGEMTSLQSYKDPQTVLLSGKCLLLFYNDIKDTVTASGGGSLVVELLFYLQ